MLNHPDAAVALSRLDALQESRSAIMNLFRVPLNLIVVLILINIDWLKGSTVLPLVLVLCLSRVLCTCKVFSICCMGLGISTACMHVLSQKIRNKGRLC